MYKKGQYFSFDAIIAAVIFMMAIVFLLSYWHSIKTFLDYQTSDVMKDSMRIASLLFVPSSPEGATTCMEIENLGFAVSWNDRRVDQAMVDTAIACSSEAGWLKTTLATPYNVSIKVSYVDTDDVFYIGGLPPDDAKEVANMRRAAAVVQPDSSTKLAYFDISVYR